MSILDSRQQPAFLSADGRRAMTAMLRKELQKRLTAIPDVQNVDAGQGGLQGAASPYDVELASSPDERRAAHCLPALRRD